jgi:hypothetical protein
MLTKELRYDSFYTLQIPIEGRPEMVNKTRILKDKNDRNGNCIHHYSISNYKIYFDIETIEEDVQDTNAGKQLS